MPTDPNPSLMDDSEFLAELEKLERVVPRERTADRHFDAGLSGLDEGLVGQDGANRPHDEWSDLPVYNGEQEERIVSTGSSTARIALAVGGLLLAMALGAGVAAYLFRDRLALILR